MPGGGRSTTGGVFEAYPELVLLPALKPGQVVVDNLSAPMGSRVRELIKARGCELLFLPPYSPDSKPVEEPFSKIKGFLRQTGARTREVLVESAGRTLDAVTTRDAPGFFGHLGTAYRSTTMTAPKEPQQGLARKRFCVVVALGQLATHLF